MISRVLSSTLLLTAVLASNGWAQVATTTDTPAATARLPRRHGPAKIHGRRPDNSVDSENWSGYAVTGSSFTKVLGSWIVPLANCNVTPGSRTSPAYSSFWVGIDGYNSSTVEQIGTDSDCDGATPVYYAWYEFYPEDSYYACPAAPAHSHTAPPCPLMSLSPGDRMSASVTYNANGTFTATITDLTKDASFSTVYTATRSTGIPQRSSAEWIAEAPCCTRNGGFLPLSDFGTVEFGADYTGVSSTNDATDGAASGAISGFGAAAMDQINMVTSSDAPEANTSSLTTDGTSFSVTWVSE